MDKAAIGVGSITWWGFSPALDFQDAAPAVAENELHILLVGAGDLRHVLLTLARRYRHERRKLNFYIVENSYELLARHMLQLAIALEPESRMGLQDKTELYLEVLGNTLVREQVMEYVQAMATLFIRMVTDLEYAASVVPWLNLDALKFKERDFLEAIFKFWRSKETKDFDVEKCWDARLRQYLQQRYDAIPNIFDWDYNMKLCERGAEIINGRLYAQWRHKGVAFELRDATYDVANRTLASGMLGRDSAGNRVARRGYFGDILVSPFILFGVGSENEKLLQRQNGVFTRNAAVISEYNVLAAFYELANRRRYDPGQEWVDGAARAAAGVGAAEPMCSIREVDEELAEDVSEMALSEGDRPQKSPLDQPFEPLRLEDVSVSLHSASAIQDLPKKAKYQKLFTHAYFSNSMVHLLHQERAGLAQILAGRSVLLVESALYMLELKMEQVELYASKVAEMAGALGHKAHGNQNPKQDAAFVFERS